MKHALALRIAQSLVRRFEPYCERIEIAGSLRRLKPEVKDIELVLIPKWEKRETVGTLFPETLECNLLHEAFERGVYNQDGNLRLLRWIKPGIGHIEDWRIYPDGRYWRGFTERHGALRTCAEFDAGCKVDVFITTAERWGTTLAIRTGAGEFSKALAGHALKVRHKLGEGGLFRVAPGGTVCGTPSRGHLTFVPTPEEWHFFHALGLGWVEPELREDKKQLYYIRGGRGS